MGASISVGPPNCDEVLVNPLLIIDDIKIAVTLIKG